MSSARWRPTLAARCDASGTRATATSNSRCSGMMTTVGRHREDGGPMSAKPPPGRSAEETQARIERLCGAVEGQLEDFSHRLTLRIREELPSFARTPFREQHNSVQEHMRTILAAVRGSAEP